MTMYYGAIRKCIFYSVFFSLVAVAPQMTLAFLIHEVFFFYIIHNDAQQSVGLLWTSDQLVAETST